MLSNLSLISTQLFEKSFLYGHAFIANLKTGLTNIPWNLDNVLVYASVNVTVNSLPGASTVSLIACAVNCNPRDNHNKPCVAVLVLVLASVSTKSCKVAELAGSSNNLLRIFVIFPVISDLTTVNADDPKRSNNLTNDSDACKSQQYQSYRH